MLLRQVSRQRNSIAHATMQTPYGTIPQGQPTAATPKRYDGKNGNPVYDATRGGHYGASANIAAQGHQPPAETFTGHWANVCGDDTSSSSRKC